MGFIAMSRVDERGGGEDEEGGENVEGGEDGEGGQEGEGEEEDWLVMTPGVGLESTGDGKGQQYRTPREVVLESGCDVIIVGRGIYGVKGGSEAVGREAERYRVEGWRAYEERLRR